MIQSLLRGRYDEYELTHVRMDFSRTLGDNGRFSLGKVLHVINIIVKMFVARVRSRPEILYYPPAGPTRLAIYRDIVVLTVTRWLFRRTVFHFHAGGIGAAYLAMDPLSRFFFRRALFRPDLAIKMADSAPDDDRILEARRTVVLPYGIRDDAARCSGTPDFDVQPPRILFAGLLRESKGPLVLIDACAELRRRGHSFLAEFMGETPSREAWLALRDRVQSAGLEDHVRWLGVLTGLDKHRAFSRAAIFCFPTYFESESFPVVVLEAMEYSLPVVATRWRGIPDQVEDGVTGYLVPIRDPIATADRLELLLTDKAHRADMGDAARRRFEQRFSEARYHAGFAEALRLLTTDRAPE